MKRAKNAQLLAEQWTRAMVRQNREKFGLLSWDAYITGGGVLQFQRRTPEKWYVCNVWPNGHFSTFVWDAKAIEKRRQNV